MVTGIGRQTVKLLVIASLLTGCSPRAHYLEPDIVYSPQRPHIDSLPSAFPPLNREEYSAAWGRELLIANALARELDLYRAITAYKRSLILIPKRRIDRVQQIEYGLFLSYYLGLRYLEAVEVFESSGVLQELTTDFPCLKELLIALCDSYCRIKQPEKALRVLSLLQAVDELNGKSLEVYEELMAGHPCEARESVRFHPAGEGVMQFVDNYNKDRLSVTKAQWLNALLPGAGYYYVGQCKAAATSLIINAIFGVATYQFCKRGEWAAGLIAGSLELGWYMGGINGAGLAAKQYNQHLYETRAKEMMVSNRLFPVLMFDMAF